MRTTGFRSMVLYILLAAFLGGLGYLLYQFVVNGSQWAMQPYNGHVYSENSTVKLGDITDRDGNLLATTEDGARLYSQDETVRRSLLHTVGDPYGYISTSVQYTMRAQLSGYNIITGLNDTIFNRMGSDIALTIDQDACVAAYNALAARTEGMTKMPQIVVVIDELADLMLVAAKEVEESICRVAQMGRAAGMHLIIATQRPSADVITGLMKANIPSRIAFAVASALESRIILDTTGAEKLVGRGDMLYFPLGSGKPLRVQGCLISDEEVASVVEFIKRQSTAEYDEEVIHEIEQHAAEKDKQGKGVGGSAPEEVGNDYDELLPAAIEVVVETGQASVSMLQRRLKLGYSRAARLVDQMEEKGIVGPFEGSKPRQLLITKEQWQEMQFKQGLVDAAPEPVPDELEFEGDAVPQSRELPPFDLED